MSALKLTPELQEKFVGLIREGNWIRTACKACGIHETTHYEWMEKGREGLEPFATFFSEIEKAEGEAEAELLRKMKKDNRWQRGAWILARRFRHGWDGGSDLANQQKQNSPAEVARIIREAFGSQVKPDAADEGSPPSKPAGQ